LQHIFTSPLITDAQLFTSASERAVRYHTVISARYTSFLARISCRPSPPLILFSF